MQSIRAPGTDVEIVGALIVCCTTIARRSPQFVSCSGYTRPLCCPVLDEVLNFNLFLEHIFEGLQKIERHFASESHVGPTAVADFEEITDSEERELISGMPTSASATF